MAEVASELKKAIEIAQVVLIAPNLTPEQVELAIAALNAAVEAAKEALELLGLDAILGPNTQQNIKLFHKGQLYILHNGELYSPHGARVE